MKASKEIERVIRRINADKDRKCTLSMKKRETNSRHAVTFKIRLNPYHPCTVI
jgi:hypothetical protein